MANPNLLGISNVEAITAFHSGIAVTTGGKGALGITTVVSNAASSGKVLKINSLTAAAIGATTGVTLQYFNDVNHASAGSTVSIGMTLSVPSFSTLAIITKDNTIYLQENTALGIMSQPETGGTIDVVCSYEEVS